MLQLEPEFREVPFSGGDGSANRQGACPRHVIAGPPAEKEPAVVDVTLDGGRRQGLPAQALLVPIESTAQILVVPGSLIVHPLDGTCHAGEFEAPSHSCCQRR